MPALLRGTAALLAALACSAAAAETYTITTSTTGPAATFELPGFFKQGDLSGTGAFDLTVKSVFDSANVVSNTDNSWMQASDAVLQITMRMNGMTYTLEGMGQVSSQILIDTDGTGQTTKRFYQSVSFDPVTYGDYATIQQYVFLGADQFPIASVLEPATAFYADPLRKGFSIVDWTRGIDGGLSQVGDAVGSAEQFHYQLALAVPEPASYAMFGAGLGLLAVAARRRRAGAR